MAEDTPASTITFNVKSSSDAKHTISILDSLTVRDLKEKLSTSEFADIPADRQRLIYSGRVMKDTDALSAYKIKDGNTVHLVKGAASNQQRNPDPAGPGSSVPPSAGVPQNIAAGTGNDPLAGLTGARYAGFAQMPSMDTFGSDGGMNMGNPEDMLRMLENPMFQSQMNEAMNNPQVIQMMENNPMFRDQPHIREMLRNPEMRRLMMDPQFIRQSMRMTQAMRGGGPGEVGNMPAPGVTDTTPQQGSGQDGTAQNNSSNPSGSDPAQTPFSMFGQPGMGMGGLGSAQQGNPFAALFGGMPPTAGAAGSTNPAGSAEQATNDASNADTARSSEQQQQASQANPFAALFNQQGAQGGQNDMMAQMTQRMMQNPEMMRAAMQMLGAGPGTAPSGQPQGQPSFNPFSLMGGGAPPVQDSRPPEEQYSDQLSQLNDMGFFDFERNVRALRMSGGRVEGAVEMLLGGTF